MRIVIPGGTGQLGRLLSRVFRAGGDEVVVLSRVGSPDRGTLPWDGRTLGPWAAAVDGADVVVNLAGRNVNCRYTAANRAAMMASRIESTAVVGAAIARAARPPRVWLQMSTATIYAHRFDAPNDEATGRIGGDEPDAPPSWRFSIEIATAWERRLAEAPTPRTRKVALRSALVLGPEPGGVFDLLLRLTRCGLGGPAAGGRQYVSWLHERDFVRAVQFLIEREDLDGAVNLASPQPLPQREFMAALRRAWDTRIGLPATRWMLHLGAFVLRTEAELILKSRRACQGGSSMPASPSSCRSGAGPRSISSHAGARRAGIRPAVRRPGEERQVHRCDERELAGGLAERVPASRRPVTHSAQPSTFVDPSRFPPSRACPTRGSPITLITDGFPAAKARSSAGRISSGRVTCSPWQPMASNIRS